MKKKYMNPEMIIVKIESRKLLTESMGFGNPTSTMDAPGLDIPPSVFDD